MKNDEWIALVALVVSIVAGIYAYRAPHRSMKKRGRPYITDTDADTDIVRDIINKSKQSETECFEIRSEPDTLNKLDEWRRKQPAPTSRSEAVRRLIEVGLTAAPAKG